MWGGIHLISTLACSSSILYSSWASLHAMFLNFNKISDFTSWKIPEGQNRESTTGKNCMENCTLFIQGSLSNCKAEGHATEVWSAQCGLNHRGVFYKKRKMLSRMHKVNILPLCSAGILHLVLTTVLPERWTDFRVRRRELEDLSEVWKSDLEGKTERLERFSPGTMQQQWPEVMMKGVPIKIGVLGDHCGPGKKVLVFPN